jgi:hypothetical protein
MTHDEREAAMERDAELVAQAAPPSSMSRKERKQAADDIAFDALGGIDG